MPLLHKYYSALAPSLDRLEVCGNRLKIANGDPRGHGTGKPGKTTSGKRRNQLAHCCINDSVPRRCGGATRLLPTDGIVRREVPLLGFGQPAHVPEMRPTANAHRLQA